MNYWRLPDSLETETGETGLLRGGLLGNMCRISPVQNDSLCYLSSDTMADSYQEERELTVSWDGEGKRKKKNGNQTFFPPFLSSLLPKLEIPK